MLPHLRRIGQAGFTLLLVLMAAAPVAQAQEFDCDVKLDYSQLNGQDFEFLRELPQRIEEYMEDNTWTEDQFEEYERIDCNIQISLSQSLTLTSFVGNLVVAMRRPIYGTGASSVVVQFTDADFQFSYTKGAPLTFDLERYDPLTSVLDYYAYLLLGYDYDTFSEFGGTPYFEAARRIADRAQSQGRQGWQSAGDDQGRVALITQILDARFRPLRQAYFNYHYDGLDQFVLDTEVARDNVLQVLTALREVRLNLPRAYAIDLFFLTKYTELAALFIDSNVSSQAYALLNELDPAHLAEYNKLTQ